MSEPPDEEDDQIFSGKSLGEDGAIRPARPIPLRNEIPTLHEDSLINDPAYEPTLVSPSRQGAPFHRTERVELAERRPAPAESDFVPPQPEPAVRFTAPDIRWGRWLLRAAIAALVVAGALVAARGSISWLQGLSFPGLGPGEAKEAKQEKRVGTPAPTLLVLSEPPGATVLVGGTEVGVTPWAGDNVWPPKEILRIEVRKAGYQTWTGLTMGGQQATLQANLRRR